MKVLISGAGIAGTTLAFWLDRYGIETVIVEKAPRLRTGGYIIDFWGSGYGVAERMGLLPEIISRGYEVREVRVVNRNGMRVAGFPATVFSEVTGDRYISLARGDLAEVIFRALHPNVEVIFGDSILHIDQTKTGVQTTFESGALRKFDLVVGADGLHSRIRDLAFGPESHFENYLGYKVAAFEVEGYQPRDELVYVMYTQVGRQIARFAMRDNRTMFLLTFRDDDPGDERPIDDLDSQKALLRKRFANCGWECPQILDALAGCKSLYFDRVSQIQMDARSGLWTRGLVTLIGDAAFCVSLLAGEGSGLAMTASYLLANELQHCAGDYAQAFANYQDQFGPFILRKQKAARRFASTFAPKSAFALFLRNQIMNLLKIRWIANAALGRDLADSISLPAQ